MLAASFQSLLRPLFNGACALRSHWQAGPVPTWKEYLRATAE
ncbi:hypothetical protein [Celeribacter sp. PS-C1]|nr:hypothetical protein [Celeribacter sp. PS-C1]